MHKLFARQIKQASQDRPDGSPDLDLLIDLVSTAYDEADKEHRMTQRSFGLMSDEMLDLNRKLEREFEARLRAQNQMRDAIESLKEGFALFDANDELVMSNSKYTEFIYFGRDEVVQLGTRFEDMVYAQARLRSEIEGSEINQNRIDTRLALHRNPGKSFEVQISADRWLLSHEQRTREGGIVGVHVDITELKRREIDLREAKEHAEMANRAKSELLANMSHELRTPLNAILGFSEVMHEELFGPLGHAGYRDYAQDIHDSGAHLLSLINDILDLSKIEAGKHELRELELDVSIVVASCLRIIAERAMSKSIRLERQIAASLPDLLADKRAFMQIILNLLSNAVKFTPEGGTITVGASIVEDGSFLLTVADTGIGMAENDIPRALSAFGQIENPLSRRSSTSGTGLGLPLVKNLIELHGGSLELRSEVGVGTTAEIRMPADRVLRHGAVAAATAGS